MSHFLVAAVVGWGFGLWLLGYILGFVFYALVPPALIGWCVMPLGIAATCLVLWRRARPGSLRDAILLGVGWAAIAVACDYIFLVRLLAPPDGYYKLDVYLYYLLTLALPIAAVLLRQRDARSNDAGAS
jgi:hypothetical protein